jgi:hypothetical protein
VTWLNVKGVKRVRAKGHTYYYHRRTMQRIDADPADATAFAAAVAKLDAGTPAKPAPLSKPRTLGELIERYRASPEFQTSIGEVTRTGYQRAFDCIAHADGITIAKVDQPWLLELRDAVAAVRRRHMGNYVVKILSIVLGWGVPRGFVIANAAKGIPKIRKRRGAPVANKAWLAAEVEAVLRAARSKGHIGLAKAVAIAYYAALRKTDTVALPSAARQKFDLVIEQSKTGKALSILQARRLHVILDLPDAQAPDDVEVPTLVRRRDGRPYTADGLDSLFDRLKRELVKAGTIRAGLTFHGLRKSLGKKAADLGFSENDIAAALGQTNPASARPYTIEAARNKGARRVFKALERKR